MSLRIAALQKQSLIDYPGKIACVVFLSGCNFRCPYCHNPDLALGRQPAAMDREQLLSFLSQRRQLLDGVVISGGEPTLCTELGELCRDIRRLDLAVKLDTNGSRPAELEQLLTDRRVDYVALDIKTDPLRYGPPMATPQDGLALVRTIKLLMTATVAYEFRTTCVRPFIDPAIIAAIAQTIRGARRYCLQTFRSETVLTPEFWSDESPGFSEEGMRRLRAIAAPWVESCRIR